MLKLVTSVRKTQLYYKNLSTKTESNVSVSLVKYSKKYDTNTQIQVNQFVFPLSYFYAIKSACAKYYNAISSQNMTSMQMIVHKRNTQKNNNQH